MKGLILLGICFITWLAWGPAILMEKKAKGDMRDTSILPVILFFTMVGSGIGIGLNFIKTNLGLYLVGGLHVILFAVFIGSVLVSGVRIKMNKSRTTN